MPNLAVNINQELVDKISLLEEENAQLVKLLEIANAREADRLAVGTN